MKKEAYLFSLGFLVQATNKEVDQETVIGYVCGIRLIGSRYAYMLSGHDVNWFYEDELVLVSL